MKCNTDKCFARLEVGSIAGMRCTQKRSTTDTRPCGGSVVAHCPHCGGHHCAKHVPSRNFYDRSIKSP